MQGMMTMSLWAIQLSHFSLELCCPLYDWRHLMTPWRNRMRPIHFLCQLLTTEELTWLLEILAQHKWLSLIQHVSTTVYLCTVYIHTPTMNTYAVVVSVLTSCLHNDTVRTFVRICSIIISPLHCSAISISFEEATYQLIEGGDVRVTLIANGTSILPFTVNITTTPGSAEGELTTSHHTAQLCTMSLICDAR